MSFARVSRAGWGAVPPRQAPYAVDYLEWFILHYVGTPDPIGPLTDQEAGWLVRDIQIGHMERNGWNDVGYNDLVNPATGTVFTGRGIGIHNAANGTDVNGRSYAVCVLAGTGDQPTRPAMATLRLLYRDLYLPQGGRGNVGGHRDFTSTTCCGDPYYNALSDISIFQPTPIPGADMAEYHLRPRQALFFRSDQMWLAWDHNNLPAGTVITVTPNSPDQPTANVCAYNCEPLATVPTDVAACNWNTPVRFIAKGGRTTILTRPEWSALITAVR